MIHEGLFNLRDLFRTFALLSMLNHVYQTGDLRLLHQVTPRNCNYHSMVDRTRLIKFAHVGMT